jgi:hypothetical protein
LVRRGRLPREDRRQRLDVDAVEDALATRLLQPRDELGAQDVDLAMQDPALLGDLPRLFLELVDLLLEVVVG